MSASDSRAICWLTPSEEEEGARRQSRGMRPLARSLARARAIFDIAEWPVVAHCDFRARRSIESPVVAAPRQQQQQQSCLLITGARARTHT